MEALGEAMAADGAMLPSATNLTHTCYGPSDGQGRGVGGWSFDCEPTLTDSQVLEFCRAGFLIIPAAVAPDVNQQAIDYLEGRGETSPIAVPEGMTMDDLERIRSTPYHTTILLERWFLEGVLLQPQLVGALRSLLGRNVGLPVVNAHHGGSQPVGPAQGWHQDADAVFGPAVNFLEVFYYPQDTPREAGPTAVLPGSHIGRRGPPAENECGVVCSCPAGTLVLHHQSILHRRHEITTSMPRHMLKFNYWRSTTPVRDWVIEPEFDPATAFYGGVRHRRFAFNLTGQLHLLPTFRRTYNPRCRRHPLP